MVPLIDTHTHPYYNDDAVKFVNDAIAAGVTRMIMPNVDLDSISPMRSLAAQFPNNLYMAMGLHPTEVKDDADNVLNRIKQSVYDNGEYVAIGEIGIDLYWDKTFRLKQMDVFDRQLKIAAEKGLPVIIHCREALDETLEVLEGNKNVQAVFHSFGGAAKDVERILKIRDDYYFGINGIVTFKNSKLSETIPAIPDNQLLLETDSPYLAPVPFRGKPNRSEYIIHVATKIATIKGKTVDEIAALTTFNAERFFDLPHVQTSQ